MPPTKDAKRAAVELWKASVPLKQIRAQLKIPERSLRRILDHAKKNSDAPIAERKLGSGRPSVISRELKIKINAQEAGRGHPEGRSNDQILVCMLDTCFMKK
jgi:hypothetical protein